MGAFVRRRVGTAVLTLVLGASGALLYYACEDDSGIRPDFFEGTVRGTLKIRTVVPDTTDEIRVALAKEFPPSSLQGLITSGVIPVQKDPDITSQDVPYEMQAPLGTYEAALVIWKAKEASFQLTDIVGIYGDLDEFKLFPIVLTKEQPVAENVDIAVDLSRVDRRSSIQGTITFVGEWPENTAIVALVVLEKLTDLTRGIPPAIAFIPEGVETFDYTLRVAAGTYNFVFVAWLPIGEFDLSRLRVLGVYEDPDRPGSTGSVTVRQDETVTGIDIVADFARATP